MIKKIYTWALALMTLGSLSMLPSCSADEAPITTASADDDPRILDPLFPDRVAGELPVFSTLNSDGTLTMTLTVTPAAYSTITWLIDGIEVQRGKTLSETLLAGRYTLKVVVTTTKGKTTYREGLVVVNPLPGEPWSTDQANERIVSPGMSAVLYGDNLDQVQSLSIGGIAITGVHYDPVAKKLSYQVPAELPEGEHRVILMDAQGKSYGANKVLASRGAVVTGGIIRSGSGAPCTIEGINLDQVASLTIGGATLSTFSSQSATSLSFTAPSLPEGSYVITGLTTEGKAISFAEGKELKSEQSFIITSERQLFSGHHYVSWELLDGDPNKTFNLIPQSAFAALTAGTTLRIYYSLKASDVYHQMRVTTGQWNDLPGGESQDYSADGVRTIVLSQTALDLIASQSGFLCVGHGYYINRITVE